MKKRWLLSFIVPLFAISGCSYRGDATPLRDGNLLLSDQYVQRDDSFAQIDHHLQAGDTFCVYLSLEGCSACERFEGGFKEVVVENKVLTFHLEYPKRSADMTALCEKYPAFNTDYSPSFFIIENKNIEVISYDTINSASRLRNTLKRKISLVNEYYFEGENIDFTSALNKTDLSEVTLIKLDFENDNCKQKYKDYKSEHNEALFIYQKPGLHDLEISKLSK